MINNIKHYFNFTRSERNGTLVLCAILLLTLITNTIVKSIKPSNNTDYKKFATEMDSFAASLKPNDSISDATRSYRLAIARYDTIKLFTFNPNTATPQQWLRLGLTQTQINVIENYLKQGGKFNKKDDLKRIYGIKPKQYEYLKSYIQLPDVYDEIQNNVLSTNKPTLFSFDPNNTSENEWLQLGLNQKQIKTINNYITNGGKFKQKEDFKKIYGISATLYTTLEPYIKIEQQINVASIKQSAPASIEINAATEIELEKLSGIGNQLAMRIIKYRNMLGGFTDRKQLLEVYGLQEETFKTIESHVTVDKVNIVRININFATSQELDKHPYLDAKQAKAIVEFRTQNGSYQNVNRLSTNNIIPNNIYEKVAPYLTVDQP